MFTIFNKSRKNNKSMLDNFYINITLFLFFILPSKISSLFVNLSILALIYNLRDTPMCKNNLNLEKINTIYKISICEEMLLLPNYTIHWFWDEDFLNSKIIIRGKEYLIKYVIRDSSLFLCNMRLIIDVFINHLPNVLKMKLGVSNIEKRIKVKHKLMNILLYI